MGWDRVGRSAVQQAHARFQCQGDYYRPGSDHEQQRMLTTADVEQGGIGKPRERLESSKGDRGTAPRDLLAGNTIAMPVTKDVLLGNGTSAVQAVAPGTTGNVLTSNGTTWVSQAAPGGAMNVLTKSTNYTISSSDVANNLLLVASANITITLPQSSLSTGKIVYVSSSIGDAFTVVCPSGNTFGGYAIATPVTGGAATFVADGNGKWHIVSYIY